jgi:hypothetical protein
MMDAGIPSQFKALRPPGGGALRAALSRLVLRLRLQPSIPQGESPQDVSIIGGDTPSRTLVMDSSGSAHLLEVPLNEPVRGTPWNHQIACAVTTTACALDADVEMPSCAYPNPVAASWVRHDRIKHSVNTSERGARASSAA